MILFDPPQQNKSLAAPPLEANVRRSSVTRSASERGWKPQIAAKVALNEGK
jgi:hypothetical protein